MKSLIYLIACLTTTLALPGAAPAPDAVPAPISDRNAEPGSLMARACSYITCCRSVGSGSPYWKGAGLYCGFCYQVAGAYTWVPGHIYQLNGNTNAASCCDYGASTKCAAKYKALGNTGYNCANTANGY